jgi:Xaa-Pro aminopeptidase
MKPLKIFVPFIVGVILLVFSFFVSAQSPEEFKQRRQAVLAKMAPNNVLILRSNEATGGFENPRIGGYFYYLTGINETNACLILRGESTRPLPPERYGRRPQIPPSELLFITPVNPARANWDAQGLGIEGAISEMGFEHVMSFREFDSCLGQLLLENPEIIYMDIQKSNSLESPLTEDEQLLKMARDKGAQFTIQSPSVVLSRMVHIKSTAEIEIIRKAVEITAEAHRTVMRSIQPDMYEYQIDGIVRYIFHINGATAAGFPCIIGSGPNSVVLHWMENSRKMNDGDVVVVDIGAEYGLYWADITRTLPVNGTYSARQKEIYEIVLKANEEAIKMVAPGAAVARISDAIDEILSNGMMDIGLIKNAEDFRKYYYHGPGHPIGLINIEGSDVDNLEQGMVITIEPGIYVKEEALGVRIEDDVLVTENGYEVLSKGVPKKINDIERLMREEGMDIKKHLINMEY